MLVHSCDSYEDVWDPFFALLNKYWADCPYEIVINTESKAYHGEKWENLSIRTLGLYQSGQQVKYGQRVIEHCRALDSEYIITMMDDFFVRSKVDTATIQRIIAWMDQDPQIACVCLVHHNDPHNVRYKYQEKELSGYSLRPRYCNFAHDMQASVWRREAYIQSWKPFESPWQWESVSNIRSFDDGWKYYDKDCYTPFAIDYINYKNGEWSGIRKGKWVKETVCELFEKNGITVDYSKRGFFDPETRTQKQSLSRHIAGHLSNLRCYGIRRAVPAACFTARRLFFQKVLHREYYENYCAYLRHKYYEK